MGWIPETVDRLLKSALVSEFAVISPAGRIITHPLIPLWDGERVYVTSSVLFSKKVQHIKNNPRVSLTISDPVATGGDRARCTIQGDARVFEDDPHTTWERVLPLWREKEPGIAEFVAKRYALPLFFERSLIEITPRKVLWWDDGDPAQPPHIATVQEVA